MEEHLSRWKLQRIESDEAYSRFQRQHLIPQELTRLSQLSARRRAGADAKSEVAFYDFAAKAHIVPVLYSQHYDYYREIGPLIAERVGDAGRILDVGCGVGILTTFYAALDPNRQVVGIDRSPASLVQARKQAEMLGLKNLTFECLDYETADVPGPFELVITTHALLQTEHDPGLPSRDWRTFDRDRDDAAQADFEARTGLRPGLDRLVATLDSSGPTGRMLIVEKARHLARRVPFQRALASRGLMLTEPPIPIQYHLVDELTEDGPFYVLERPRTMRAADSSNPWKESPEWDETARFDPDMHSVAAPLSDQPLYENHSPTAEVVWAHLPQRRVVKEATRQEPDGRQLHVELGAFQHFTYLYCANTFDQRQLVIVESSQKAIVESYYEEIARSLSDIASQTPLPSFSRSCIRRTT